MFGSARSRRRQESRTKSAGQQPGNVEGVCGAGGRSEPTLATNVRVPWRAPTVALGRGLGLEHKCTVCDVVPGWDHNGGKQEVKWEITPDDACMQGCARTECENAIQTRWAMVTIPWHCTWRPCELCSLSSNSISLSSAATACLWSYSSRRDVLLSNFLRMRPPAPGIPTPLCSPLHGCSRTLASPPCMVPLRPHQLPFIQLTLRNTCDRTSFCLPPGHTPLTLPRALLNCELYTETMLRAISSAQILESESPSPWRR